MRSHIVATVLFSLSLVCADVRAQEIILKDGTKISWKTLADAGDRLEVKTSAGKKLTVRKSEIQDITSFSPKEKTLLTGALVTFKKRTQALNLLAGIDPKRDTFVGSWKFSGGALHCGITRGPGGAEFTRLMVDHPVPEEYDLHLVLERTKGTNLFGVGLVAGGKQFLFVFDRSTRLSALWGKDRQKPEGDPDVKNGTTFKPRKPRAIVFMIRKKGLIVQVDGKDFYTYDGGWGRLSLEPHLTVPRKDVLFLLAQDAEWKIRKMVLVSER